jgi:flagellar biosynthetic protein FliP
MNCSNESIAGSRPLEGFPPVFGRLSSSQPSKLLTQAVWQRFGRTLRRLRGFLPALLLWSIHTAPVSAAGMQPIQTTPESSYGLEDWVKPEQVSSTLNTVLLVSALSLAPALLLMTTSFVRIGIVLALLRQAIGAQGVPSNQVLSALALFMTAAIMSPVWKAMHQQAIVPYRAGELSGAEALARAQVPLHRFMARQIERTGNADDIWLFLEKLEMSTTEVSTYDDVPMQALAPAFLLSELKTAFVVGFQIYLPFLIVDLVVSAVLASLGLITVSPTLVSLPTKLLLFVLVDGWHLVVGTLLDSFAS